MFLTHWSVLNEGPNQMSSLIFLLKVVAPLFIYPAFCTSALTKHAVPVTVTLQ